MHLSLATIHAQLTRAVPDTTPVSVDGYGVRTHELSHKEYRRFPHRALPDASLPKSTLYDALQNCEGKSQWQSGIVSDEALSGMLSTLRGQADGMRPYSSVDSLYPVETYVLYENILYHYHPTGHYLEQLWSLDSFDIDRLFYKTGDSFPPCAFLFTSVWEKTIKKYGHMSYRLGTLESAHMAQNIILSATAFGLKAISYPIIVPELAAELLHLDTEIEQLVYMVGCGHFKVTQ